MVEGMAGDVKVQVRLTGQGRSRATPTRPPSRSTRCRRAGARHVSAAAGRRPASTWVPTADPRFRRQERVRVSVGVGADTGTLAGTLLDRQGRPMNVPVKVDRPRRRARRRARVGAARRRRLRLRARRRPAAAAGAAAHRAACRRMSTSRVVRSAVVTSRHPRLGRRRAGGRVRAPSLSHPPSVPTRASCSTDVFVTADGKPVTDLARPTSRCARMASSRPSARSSRVPPRCSRSGSRAAIRRRWREQRHDRRSARLRGVPRQDASIRG